MASQNNRSQLDNWFPRDAGGRSVIADGPGKRLGVVVGGSLSKGLQIKLDRETSIEDLAVGRYVVVRGLKKRFFLHGHRYSTRCH